MDLDRSWWRSLDYLSSLVFSAEVIAERYGERQVILLSSHSRRNHVMGSFMGRSVSFPRHPDLHSVWFPIHIPWVTHYEFIENRRGYLTSRLMVIFASNAVQAPSHLYSAADAAKTIVGLKAAENPEPNPSSLKVFQSPNRKDMQKPEIRRQLVFSRLKTDPGTVLGYCHWWSGRHRTGGP
jgi:hypothetical protein